MVNYFLDQRWISQNTGLKAKIIQVLCNPRCELPKKHSLKNPACLTPESIICSKREGHSTTLQKMTLVYSNN